MRREAEQGNEVALAVLRFRQKAVEPEMLPPDRDYSELAAVKAAYAEKQVEVLQNGDLAAKGKKRLLAFLRMEQVVREEKLRTPQARDEKMTISVDNKGAVVFSFAGGGKIRDCGGEILFSSDLESFALLYARKKWGQNCMVDEGRIFFDRARLERETVLPPQPMQDKRIER